MLNFSNIQVHGTMWHFVWVYAVCPKARLGVSGPQTFKM